MKVLISKDASADNVAPLSLIVWISHVCQELLSVGHFGIWVARNMVDIGSNAGLANLVE